MPINPNKKHRIGVSLPNEIYKDFSDYAKKRDWSESKTGAKLIEIGLKYIKQDERTSK